MSVCSATLVFADSLEGSNARLPGQNTGMHGRVREPEENDDSHQDGETTEKDVDDLIRRDDLTVVERYAVSYEATKYLCEAILRPNSMSKRAGGEI